jgi:hypothetical protein
MVVALMRSFDPEDQYPELASRGLTETSESTMLDTKLLTGIGFVSL